MIDDAMATTIHNRRPPPEAEGEGVEGRPAVPPWSVQGAEAIYERRRLAAATIAKREAERAQARGEDHQDH